MNISTIHNVICVGILSWQKLQPDSEVKGPLHVPHDVSSYPVSEPSKSAVIPWSLGI